MKLKKIIICISTMFMILTTFGFNLNSTKKHEVYAEEVSPYGLIKPAYDNF